MYPVMYYTHNLHFLAISSSMEGRFDEANRIATKVVTEHDAVRQGKPDGRMVPADQDAGPDSIPPMGGTRRSFPSPTRTCASGTRSGISGVAWLFTGVARLDKAAAERDALTAEIEGSAQGRHAGIQFRASSARHRRRDAGRRTSPVDSVITSTPPNC